MPRYYFDLLNGTGLTGDEEGLELADFDAARRTALKAARSVLSHEVLHGRLDLDGRIDVRDGSGGVVLQLPFSEAVEVKGA